MENQNSKVKPLVITREFNAPIERVFDAFANPDSLAQWWGPPGTPIEVVRHEFRPSGIFLYKATMQGQTAWGKFVYGQISKPTFLEFTSSFSNENADTIRAPFSAQFPMEIFNRLEFKSNSNKTTIVLQGYPVNATAEEIDFFNSMQANMQQGFAGTFTQLEKFLEK